MCVCVCVCVYVCVCVCVCVCVTFLSMAEFRNIDVMIMANQMCWNGLVFFYATPNASQMSLTMNYHMTSVIRTSQ